MKYDISLNGKKYVVEIDDSYAEIVDSAVEDASEAEKDDVSGIPDFDFDRKEVDSMEITAPLPGVVMSVMVQNRERVRKGQTLLVLESMKMENTVTAPMDGVIDHMSIQVGDAVAKGERLLSMEAAVAVV